MLQQAPNFSYCFKDFVALDDDICDLMKAIKTCVTQK